jgi:hypothetical protein
LEDGSPVQGSPFTKLYVGVFVVLLGFTVLLTFLSIPAGVYAVFSGHLSKTYDYTALLTPYFWIGPAVTSVPFQLSVGAWFLILTAIYVAFFAIALKQKQGPLQATSAAFKEGLGAIMSSPFVVVMVSIGFLTFTASIADDLISSAGVPIGGLSGDPLALIIGFTAAPLVEELGFRVLIIGVVALILSMRRPLREVLGSLWRPSVAVEGLALGSGASIIIWVATGFSAATFGICHVACGGTSWDTGKVLEAGYAGVVLGYLYVRYGFHVAVLAHWGVNFLGSAFAFFGQAAYGIPWDSNTGEFIGQYLVDLDLLLLFGLASFVLVLYLGVKKLAGSSRIPETGDFDKAPSGGGTVEA